MSKWDTVAIIGVGLIGGSIGLALRSRGLAREVVGIGRTEKTLRVARRVGAITRATRDVAAGVKEADVVVACTPVATVADQIVAAAAACPPGALLTDAGSTKAGIVSALSDRLDRQSLFVGSHPLAGGERTGPAEASSNLFDGRAVVVTPTSRTKPEATQRAEQFWMSLGARVVEMTPVAHDRAVAAISHLPHLAAVATAAAVEPQHLELAATGFQDTTRVASGDPEMWTQIFMANRDPVLKATERLQAVLERFHAALDQGNAAQLRRILNDAKRKRDAVGN